MYWAKNFFNNISSHFGLTHNIDNELIEFFSKMGMTYTSQVLDQCCGNGTLQIALTKHIKCKTFGIDINNDYIELAKQRAFNQKIVSKFICQDVLENKCVGLFNYVINWNTSWAYFEDDERNISFIQHAFINLRQNGKYIIETYNSNFIKSNFKELILDKKTVNGIEYTIEKKCSINNDILSAQWIIKNSEGNIIFDDTGYTKLYTEEQIINFYEQVGFKDIKTYNDLSYKENAIPTSRFIIVGTK